jgi:hypothetical protein
MFIAGPYRAVRSHAGSRPERTAGEPRLPLDVVAAAWFPCVFGFRLPMRIRVRPLKLLVKEISKDACGNDKYCQCVKHNLHNLGEPFAVFSGHEALVLENLRLISLIIPVFTVSVHLVQSISSGLLIA